MSLTTNSNTQNLFFKSDKKREFSDVLNEVQSYISSKYSSLVIDGINNVNSGNDEVKLQVKRYIGKYLLDYRISVEGLTQTELVDKLYTEMAEFSFLTKYIFGTGIEERNINSWDDMLPARLPTPVVCPSQDLRWLRTLRSSPGAKRRLTTSSRAS